MREEIVLVIRKAFTFEDISDESLELCRHPCKGFGFVLKSLACVYILAHPDIVNRRIRVTYRLWDPPEEVCYIDCKLDIPEAGDKLRSMIEGFLAEVALHIAGERIRW